MASVVNIENAFPEVANIKGPQGRPLQGRVGFMQRKGKEASIMRSQRSKNSFEKKNAC